MSTKSENAGIHWIAFHERAHLELGHFSILEGVPTFNLISKSGKSQVQQPDLPRAVWDKVERCLELQADHEALEEMLGNIDAVSWSELRVTVASIAVVMVLIEKADADNPNPSETHPKAATRIFQLLGHVNDMWSIGASVNGANLPEAGHIQALAKEVILPAYFDAVEMAKSADAASFVDDLGDPEIFFADIAHAKLGHWDQLQTVGAKEWAELKDANEQILPLVYRFQAEKNTST
ncbi:hypothetical protein [Halocynthiibacter namhaensis]|uniref:hypothetical protein n=1 Tax=Halocynthiibacter namhaensis TaxID=1290553 RepID=UPI000578E4DE|nr:hypothetical protein [Halocynthiibacter namhaensis]